MISVGWDRIFCPIDHQLASQGLGGILLNGIVLYVRSSIAITLKGKRELVALLNLSSWCLVTVERLFLAVPRGCLWFVIVVFPDHTHLLFTIICTHIVIDRKHFIKY